MAEYKAVITSGTATETTVAKTALWQYGKKFFFSNVDGEMRHVGCDAEHPLKFRIARSFVFTKDYDDASYKRINW